VRVDAQGQTSGHVVGRVVAAQAFPLKGAGALPADSIELDADGVVGDRRHAVVTDTGNLLTADDEPRLRDVLAASADGGPPLLTVPTAAGDVRGEAADAALTAFLGRPVRVAAAAPARTLDAPVHLVTRQALDAAARGEHDAADCACSLSEPRANLVVDATDGREEGWIGLRLAVGDAVLRVLRRPGHCLGVYAEVEHPGRVRTGDPVVVEEG
jgi:MOSC domain-containing protein